MTSTENLKYSLDTRLDMLVLGVSPFVYNNSQFLQVASVADMHLLPRNTAGLNRRNSISLLFRTPGIAWKIRDQLVNDINTLAEYFQSIQEKTGQVLYENLTGSSSSESDSSSSSSSSSSSTDSSSFLLSSSAP